MGKKLDLPEFLRRARICHSDTYDYSHVTYQSYNEKVVICCRVHGDFNQTPSRHLRGFGCPLCAKSRVASLTLLDRFTKVHGDRYDYSFVEYRGVFTPVLILCRQHGLFEQAPKQHLLGRGCRKCSQIDCDSYIQKMSQTHDGFYDYSLITVFSWDTKVPIICPKHGVFNQRASHHVSGQGCPQCRRRSRAERQIEKYLTQNGIGFEVEKTFPDCINPDTGYLLRFDFFLPEQRLLIEYDGEFHYKSAGVPVRSNQFRVDLESIMLRDRIKDQYAANSGITLVRIPYWDLGRFKSILADHLILPC